jgi:hypothetical protein
MFWLAWEGAVNAETGEVTLPAKPRRKTYKQQNWRAYEAAQMTERARVPQLLHSLCESCVDEPEGVPGKPGRKPIPRREAIYAAVMKVYSCCSGRRADPDIKADVDRGHLAASTRRTRRASRRCFMSAGSTRSTASSARSTAG